MFYLVNSTGVIERRWEGAPPLGDLKSAIRELVGE
jgi:hypothetical protein